MLSRKEYERIVQIFLVELNHLCMEASETDLRSLPRFASEIDSYLGDLQDPANAPDYVLRTAFAYVDEYVGADWEKVADAGFAAYVLSQQQ